MGECRAEIEVEWAWDAVVRVTSKRPGQDRKARPSFPPLQPLPLFPPITPSAPPSPHPLDRYVTVPPASPSAPPPPA